MPAIIDPATNRPAPPSDPNQHDVACQCGYINRVRVMMPRVYNAPSTSIAVGEHCEPFLCHGCLKMVTPCIVEIKEVVMVCMPMHVNDVQVKPPVPAADNEVTEIDPADTVVM